MSAQIEILQALTKYVAAFREVPKDASRLIKWHASKPKGAAEATQWNYTEVQSVIRVYQRNLDDYRSGRIQVSITRQTKSTPTTPKPSRSKPPMMQKAGYDTFSDTSPSSSKSKSPRKKKKKKNVRARKFSVDDSDLDALADTLNINDSEFEVSESENDKKSSKSPRSSRKRKKRMRKKRSKSKSKSKRARSKSKSKSNRRPKPPPPPPKLEMDPEINISETKTEPERLDLQHSAGSNLSADSVATLCEELDSVRMSISALRKMNTVEVEHLSATHQQELEAMYKEIESLKANQNQKRQPAIQQIQPIRHFQPTQTQKVKVAKATLKVQPAMERKESLSASGSVLGMDVIDVARLVMYASDSEYETDAHEIKAEHEHGGTSVAEAAVTTTRRNSSPRNHRRVSWKLEQSATGPTPKNGGIGGCCSNPADEQEGANTTEQRELLKAMAQTDYDAYEK